MLNLALVKIHTHMQLTYLHIKDNVHCDVTCVCKKLQSESLIAIISCISIFLKLR